MMGHMQNEMRRQALGVLSGLDHVRVGIIQSYDKANHCCKVLIQPENVLTGWLPLRSAWVGNGWGMFAPPAPGAAVSVIPVEGSLDAAYCVPGFFNDGMRPLPVDQGEFWLVHKTGSFFKLTNDGKLKLSDGHGSTITFNGDGTITSTGNLSHTGTAHVVGDTTVDGNAIVNGNATVNGDATISGNATIGQTITAVALVASSLSVTTINGSPPGSGGTF